MVVTAVRTSRIQWAACFARNKGSGHTSISKCFAVQLRPVLFIFVSSTNVEHLKAVLRAKGETEIDKAIANAMMVVVRIAVGDACHQVFAVRHDRGAAGALRLIHQRKREMSPLLLQVICDQQSFGEADVDDGTVTRHFASQFRIVHAAAPGALISRRSSWQ